jgi:hypothetical protein
MNQDHELNWIYYFLSIKFIEKLKTKVNNIING